MFGGESSVLSGTLCVGVNQVWFQGPCLWGGESNVIRNKSVMTHITV